MATDDLNLTGWIVGAIGTAFGTLGATVATLFKLNESKNAHSITVLEERLVIESQNLKAEIAKANERAEISDKKHEECLHDREEIRVQLAELRGSVDAIKNYNAEKQT